MNSLLLNGVGVEKIEGRIAGIIVWLNMSTIAAHKVKVSVTGALYRTRMPNPPEEQKTGSRLRAGHFLFNSMLSQIEKKRHWAMVGSHDFGMYISRKQS
jgi:hypothetical protein